MSQLIKTIFDPILEMISIKNILNTIIMKRVLIILILAVFTFAWVKTQEPYSSNTSDSTSYGYYYCFTFIGEATMYYTGVFSEIQGTSISKTAIEQSWQAYVHNNLNQPDYSAFVTGPFGTSENAGQDRQSWMEKIPDTLSRQEVQYIYQPNQ
jgi:hypothetical protein